MPAGLTNWASAVRSRATTNRLVVRSSIEYATKPGPAASVPDGSVATAA
ncbi:MAG TPA: hypothetical protein VFB84_20975 [Micromonosporaceae bacterium]|nr:hypothetical protein [Micromonosporaceae bacterium]